ncbi:MAG TPA: hypothetical protein VF062_11065 [Candidatus Limnocylindrales bacterium]
MPDGATLARARHLVSQLDFRAAQQVLHETMGRANQDPGQAGQFEAEAATLYAGVLLHLADPVAAGNWAGYAYSAMRRLQGERDHRTLHALGVLAVTQHRAGALDLACRSYQQLVTALSAVDGPDADRTLAAKADGAGVDHALGRCAEARATMEQVVAAHRMRNGPAHPVGIRMTARLAAMWRDCGEFQRARDLVTQAKAQAVALAGDDETHRLLDAATQAVPNPGHRCGLGAPPPLVVPQPHDLLPPPPSRSETVHPNISEWPDDDIADAPANLPPQPQPVNLAPPAGAPAPPPPPQLVYRPMTPPPPPRPVKPAREPNPGRARAIGFIAMGAVAAVAVSLVVVAMLASGTPEKPAGASTSQQPDAPATPTPDAAEPGAEPSGPVGNLRLVDNATSLSVTWIYPANAKGPIIVSAATAGEPMKALQSLPAGTESYVLPGLNPDRDYCVAVTIAYRTDHMVMSSPACTSRKPS